MTTNLLRIAFAGTVLFVRTYECRGTDWWGTPIHSRLEARDWRIVETRGDKVIGCKWYDYIDEQGREVSVTLVDGQKRLVW